LHWLVRAGAADSHPAPITEKSFKCTVRVAQSTTGFAEVNNRFGGNCFNCHAKARPEWDLVCGSIVKAINAAKPPAQ
jgi:hypothetical protein